MMSDRPLGAAVYVLERCPATFHVHEVVEVCVLTRGAQERIFADGTTVRTRAGDVSLIPTSEPHGWSVLEDDSVAVVLEFMPTLLGEQLLGDLPWLTLFTAPPRSGPEREIRPSVRG